jgi:hypothetical protein
MTELPPNNLEQLLERLGSVETPECLEHRYALRRALLNSPRFERNRFRMVWTRLFTYTATFVAGGAVVAVLVVSVMTVELRGRESLVDSQESGVGSTKAIESDESFVSSDASEADDPGHVEFVSFTERPDLRHVLEFARPATDFAVAR